MSASDLNVTPVLGISDDASYNRTKITDYVGNKIYENGSLKRILVDGGYIENNAYHYYLADHLGNNRVVAKADASIVQSTHYYPFGMAFADGTGQAAQPYKFSGKELDSELGLNIYDSQARQLTSGLPRFTSVDPMAEKYYSISPYVYCMNNPVKYIDRTGMDIWIYDYDEEGNERDKMKYTPGMEYKGKNETFSRMTSTLNKMNTTSLGGKLLSHFDSHKGNFNYTNIQSTKGSAHASPNSDGGANFAMGDKSSLNLFGHESFHGYEYSMGDMKGSVQSEVDNCFFVK